MIKQLKNFLLFFLPLIALFSCKDEVEQPNDTLSKGAINIAVDETFLPVIKEQLKVFDSSYPEAQITAKYQPESACFKDFISEKSRVILATRMLNNAEIKECEQQKIVPTTLVLARDAVAVIVHNSNKDTQLDLQILKGILLGTYAQKYTVVFDNNGSSTLRFITDSILKGKPLGANVFAAKSNQSVVDYVSKNPNAIGFVGLGYVCDDRQMENGEFLKTVKVVSLKNDSTQEFYKPYQAYLALKLYPLFRNLYFIKNESYPGLGTGFTNFMMRERGQLIFNHSHLFPLRMTVTIRQANLNTNNPLK